jgi:hypothetical protein
MSKSTLTLSQLAEGIQRTTATSADERMIGKWNKTGLLEGLSNHGRQKMARLLENQAAAVLGNPSMLNESLSLSTGGAGLASSGQVAGFTNVAFPIVRRVFAGLVANEIVSVQPMSLPSGLLFYLDYTYGSNVGGDAGTAANKFSTTSATAAETYSRTQSVYTNPSGSAIRTGAFAAGGQYNLIGQGYSKIHVQGQLPTGVVSLGVWSSGTTWATGSTVSTVAGNVGYNARFTDYDPTLATDVENNQLDYTFLVVSASQITTAINGADLTTVEQLAITGLGSQTANALNVPLTYQGGDGVKNFRRFTKRGNWTDAGASSTFLPDPFNGTHVLFALALANGQSAPTGLGSVTTQVTASATIADRLEIDSINGSALTIPSFESNFDVDASPRIPDVDIKIDAVSVTATTRKLRARWSPEMAQDLTAYYSIDVEAELTNILSEMITLDIDREILNDLLTQATAANYFWSRAPGRFVNKYTGTEAARTASGLYPGPQFAGTVREWYETLIETITDAANVIHKKTLRGSGNFIVCSPEVGTVLEATVAYRANYKIDSDGQVRDNMSIGAEAVGTVNGRYSVFVDPYFPVNKILVGLKGSTFLESGYIYAPYVPLILTPVIYGQEDFTPRKGIMTRYGKKMVRADFYATVTCLDMQII